jgi:hypothetical protein
MQGIVVVLPVLNSLSLSLSLSYNFAFFIEKYQEIQGSWILKVRTLKFLSFDNMDKQDLGGLSPVQCISKFTRSITA